MARIVEHEGQGPVEVKEKSWICMCGLSKNKPYCDGAHSSCSGEADGKVYEYDSEGQRAEVKK
ncbi:MAG: CDGSH iron-sulfur domain-containing protein [Candidatus Micrarchaeia archaeon]